MKKVFLLTAFVGVFATLTFSQRLVSPVISGVRVSDADLIKLVKAEDSRDAAPAMAMFGNSNAAVRYRAALAAGRIGDVKAIDGLAAMLLSLDNSVELRAMAAFALGEIESPDGADALLKALKSDASPPTVRARAVEALGKIAAAHPKNGASKMLGNAIIETLNSIANKPAVESREVALMALTAALRARPDGADVAVTKFLTSLLIVVRHVSETPSTSTLGKDPRIRADALNTLARLRAKVDGKTLRELVMFDKDDNVRINALRLFAAADDKELDNLLIAALTDANPAVRIAVIRAMASLNGDKGKEAAAKLLDRGKQLLIPMHGDPVFVPGMKPGQLKPIVVPYQKNELLEIATTLGRLMEKTDDPATIAFLIDLAGKLGYGESETFIALARVSPKAMIGYSIPGNLIYRDFHVASAYGQGLGEIAATKNDGLIGQAGVKLTELSGGMATKVAPADQAKMLRALPNLIGAMAALKPDNLNDVLLSLLKNTDPFIRAAVAGALADLPSSKENVDALNTAFTYSLLQDKHEDDAQLAILDAIAKLDKKAGVGTFGIALASQDYLVRKKAIEILSDKELQAAFPGVPLMVENARNKGRDKVEPYTSAFGTKLGQVLNTDLDYKRALSRKNGSVKAVMTTEKGTFTIVFNPEEAPLTVDNFVKLARSGYFNGLEVHRVVPDFVMQDGDPRGDGNGGPGWSIRCEVNMLPYDRGAVGMALSGKDTGGSQWFVTHLPAPHLDGGYTVFGHVNETDMRIVDNIVRGDKILKVTVVEGNLPQKGTQRVKK